MIKPLIQSVKPPTRVTRRSTVTGFYAFIIVVLLLGLCLRFTNIDRKIYWTDEVYTSLQISGYTKAEMNQQLRTGAVIGIADLQKYQYPGAERGAIDTIKVLAEDDSQHVPLYHVIVHYWVKWFGHSIYVTRSFSVIVSLLVFPSVYWLCQELFDSPQVGWMAMGLIAISPFHLLYAQEARPYSLHILLTVLSSAVFLQALRVQKPGYWARYGAVMILGLYTQIFFALVAIGHGIYLLLIEQFRFTQKVKSYLITASLGLLAFSPWIFVVTNSPSQFNAKSWANADSSFLASLSRWGGIVSRAFVDFGIGSSDSFEHALLLMPLILAVILLLIYSVYFLCKNTAKNVWLFVLTLIGTTALAFALPDFVFGLRYATTRFLTACILGLQLSLAYLLASQVTSASAGNHLEHRYRYYAGLTVLIFSIGLFSCLTSSQAQLWWNKAPERNQYIPEVAGLVNLARHPLLISDTQLTKVQTLGYLLDPKVQLQLVDKESIPDIPAGFDQVFLFEPSELLRSQLQSQYNAEERQLIEPLWQLAMPPDQNRPNPTS